MKYYEFFTSRSGEAVPAIITEPGNAKPLHSLVDPVREGQRLVSDITDDTGFVIFLGLGGGFAPQALQENSGARITVIDFNKEGIVELLSGRDYSKLLEDTRFTLLIDPSGEELKNFILENYKPALHGGIKTIPLRTRTAACDSEKFEKAASVIQEAVKTAAADYSVQAHFGKRWFSNILRNLISFDMDNQINTTHYTLDIKHFAIVAAGPSLDNQITALNECKERGVFIICADTALPVLLYHRIEPNAVVSIDCQHISYYHFLGCKTDAPLFLDIASPPLLRSFTQAPVFFSSGHPLALYIAKNFYTMPHIDTSGGNVTYACLSLAEFLGAKHITLFGADFSYIGARSYARGTYIYPYFESRQNRLSPMEALFSSFLYRAPFLAPEVSGQKYRETSQLRFYREKLEAKATAMSAVITTVPGEGAEILIKKNNFLPRIYTDLHGLGDRYFKTKVSTVEFLNQYRNNIAGLPLGCFDYMNILNEKQRQVFTTLLPLAAFLKHRNSALKEKDLIEEIKKLCIAEIKKMI